MKAVKIIVATLFLGGATLNNSIAQEHVFSWANSMGSAGGDEVGKSVTTDQNGDVLFTGYFRNTVDFDPGAGTLDYTSAGGADVYVQKLDSDGNLIWAAQIGGTADDDPGDIATDAAGNVYVTGYFTGTVDFDPGAGTQNLTSNGSGDVFIMKLDASGNYVWAVSVGAGGIDPGRSISIDPSGNILVCGFFYNTVDFDPGAGVSNLSSSGQAEIFILKLDANGNFVWAKNVGGAGNDDPSSIATDASGNVYTTGYFTGTADFDPGAGTQFLTSAGSGEIFILKLDAAGNYVWANRIGGTGNDTGISILVDNAGEIVATGFFNGTVDFDPGAGTQNLTSNGQGDIFVAKYDQNGTYQWAVSVGSNQNEEGFGVTYDTDDNIYVTGYFRGVTDFDPGASTQNFTAAGGADFFLLKLDNLGNYVWAKTVGGTADDHAFAIHYSNDNSLYSTGYFSGTADFNTESGVSNLSSTGLKDIFTMRLKECFPDATNDVIVACDSYTWIDGNTYTSNNNTATYTLTNIGGCDSVISLNLTITSIADQGLVASATTICDSDNITIDMTSSESDVTYWLRDDANDTIIDGPLTGTGGLMTFNAGTVNQSMDYNVYAEKTIDYGVEFVNTNMDRVEVAQPFTEYGNEMTVEAWIYFDGSVDAPWMGQSVFNSDNMGTNVWIWHGSGPSDISFYVNDNGTWRTASTSTLGGLMGWHHIATVASSAGLEIYVDGVLDGTGPGITGNIQNSTNSVMHIGNDTRYPNDPNRHGSYGISEFRVWNVARSTTDIQNNMNNCLAGNEAGLVYYNKFSDNTGTVATANIGVDGNFSAGMNSSAWITGPGTCESNCTSEMSQIVSVTVNQSTSNTVPVSNCVSYTWAQNGQTYTASGMYNDTIPNAVGCDSVITLDLTILNPTSSSINASDCFSYTVPSGDETYAMSGIYMDTIPNMAGCDSVITINLTIGASNSNITETACFTYTVPSGDESYTISGIYNDTIPSTAGCDSIITIDLTVNQIDINVTVNDPSMTADHAGGQYQWLDCDNSFAPVSGAISQMYTATANGNYAVEITDNGCVDTSACITISTVGIDDFNQLQVAVYPNPSDGNIWIEIPHLEGELELTIRSLDGKIVYNSVLTSSKELISLGHLTDGIYTIEIVHEDQKFINKIRLF